MRNLPSCKHGFESLSTFKHLLLLQALLSMMMALKLFAYVLAAAAGAAAQAQRAQVVSLKPQALAPLGKGAPLKLDISTALGRA